MQGARALRYPARFIFLAALVIFLAALASATAAAAQPAHLVTDLVSRPPGSFSTAVVALLGAHGKAFYTIESSDGYEVSASDGTTAGTQLLADSCRGSCSPGLIPLGAVGDVAFWEASLTDSGPLLMRSDGTRAGTFRLAGPDGDLAPRVSSPWRAVIAGGRLIFAGTTSAGGSELWQTDGTEAGTVQIADILPGPVGSFPQDLAVAGSAVYFTASPVEYEPAVLYVIDGPGAAPRRLVDLPDPVTAIGAAGSRAFYLTRTELWTSDGTSAGTRRLASFADSGGNAWIEPAGDRVLFIANDGSHGLEVWRSDGTTAGTVRLTNLPTATDSSGTILPQYVEQLGERTLLIQSRQLLSIAGPGQPAAVLLTTACAECYFESGLQRLGDRVLFRYGVAASHQLWSTDGTAAGTVRLADFCQSCGNYGYPSPVLPGGYFFGLDGSSHIALQTTAGTVGTTRVVATLPDGVVPQDQAVVVGNRVFFSASTAIGSSMWVLDTTTGVSRRLPNVSARRPTPFPHSLAALGDEVVFAASGRGEYGEWPELWSSRGTAATTAPLTDGPYGFLLDGGPQHLMVNGGKAFFWGYKGVRPDPRPLWRSDGTAAGTFPLLADQRIADAPPAFLGSQAFYVLDEPATAEVWKTDGTVAGTQVGFTLPAGVREPQYLAAAGNEIYFVALSIDGLEAWRSDGTTAGVQRVTAFASDNALYGDPAFVKTNGGVVFSAKEGNAFDPELWVTGGSPASTRKLAPSLQFYQPRRLAVAGGKLYFFAQRVGVQGRGLWRTDGTDAGTVLLAAVSEPNSFKLRSAQLGGRLYFAANDGAHGLETWSTDGTPGGTAMVADLAPGTASSFPDWFAVAGGRVYFAAHDGVHGFELWKSDGTAAGTKLVHDIAPGASSSFPEELAVVGSLLYFTADDGITGEELWVLDLAAPSTCVASDTALCLGGHFRVEATWVVGEQMGAGHTVPLTADTGGFWFFGPQNVEVVLKVLDGRGVNGHQWVFYGALSNVEYHLTVTDTDTGLTRRYVNPSGELASVGDTTGFGPQGAYSTVRRSRRAGAATPPRVGTERGAIGVGQCEPAPTRLCLSGGRFAVEASWKDFAGNSGVGTAVVLTADTGWFWFFGPTNVEVILKVLDGTPVNGKFWVFYGALSSVEYTLRVTDTLLGTVRTYTNPSGNLASVADTGAF